MALDINIELKMFDSGVTVFFFTHEYMFEGADKTFASYFSETKTARSSLSVRMNPEKSLL